MEIGEWQGIKINKTYSHQSYAHGKLSIENCGDFPIGTPLYDLKPDEFPPGLAIVGTNFSCEMPETQVFPDGVRDLIFINCNLNNIILPDGSQLCEDSCNQHYQVQYLTRTVLDENGVEIEEEYNEDWVVDISVSDENEPEKKIYIPIAAIGTPEAAMHWGQKRDTPLDTKSLLETVEEVQG